MESVASIASVVNDPGADIRRSGIPQCSTSSRKQDLAIVGSDPSMSQFLDIAFS